MVFGGILGDHPPQDRAKDFRETFSHIRKLGTVQMTTDTAVLVSHEILGQQRAFESLEFIDEPTIPMDDSVRHFLDMSMPHTKLLELPESVTDFKEQTVDGELRREASQVNDELSGGSGAQADIGGVGVHPETGNQDAMVEMSTIMEGFRYRKNDNTVYPVLKDGQPCPDFPIIPVGMLSIWREQGDEGDLDAMLGM